MEAEEPAQLLAAAARAAKHTREARRGFWFPLVLFGIIVIGAAPWYGSRATTGCFDAVQVAPQVEVCHAHAPLFGFFPGVNSAGATLYWLIAVVLGYAVTVAFYQWRRFRTGVAGRVLPYALAGAVLLALSVLATPTVAQRWRLDPLAHLPGDLVLRGMTPLLVIALGLFVLAWLERSLPLTAFAVLFLIVALVSNLYDVENQTTSLGWTSPQDWTMVPNLWLSGFTLLLGGLGFGLAVAARSRGRG